MEESHPAAQYTNMQMDRARMQPGTVNVVEPGYVPGLELGCAEDQMMSKVDRQTQQGTTVGSDRMLRKELGTQTGMCICYQHC